MTNSAPALRKGGVLNFKKKVKKPEEPRKRGRGERAGVDRQAVVNAGLDLLSRLGADGFTSRSLARELGVHTGTILTKFDGGFGGVRAAMADSILKDLLPDLPPDADPPEYVRTLFRNALVQLAGKGAVAQLAAIALAQPASALSLLEGLLAALRAAMIHDDEIPSLCDRVLSLLAGMLLVESSPPAVRSSEIRHVSKEDSPVLHSFAAVFSKDQLVIDPVERADLYSADIALLLANKGNGTAK